MVLEMKLVSVVLQPEFGCLQRCVKRLLAARADPQRRDQLRRGLGHFFGGVLLVFETHHTHPCFNTSALRCEFSCHGSKICLLGATVLEK